VLGSVADEVVRGAEVPVCRKGGQMMPYGGMGGLMLVYASLWILIVGAVVVALWRGMQAQEKMARHLEAIERTLAQRSGTL
jgi:uncharacterized membrane protein